MSETDLMSQFADLIAARLKENTVIKAEEVIPRYYTMDEVCNMVRISRATGYRHKNLGLLAPARYVGRKPLFTQESIDNYLNHFVV